MIVGKSLRSHFVISRLVPVRSSPPERAGPSPCRFSDSAPRLFLSVPSLPQSAGRTLLSGAATTYLPPAIPHPILLSRAFLVPGTPLQKPAPVQPRSRCHRRSAANASKIRYGGCARDL